MLLEESNLKSYNASLIGVFFLYRRFWLAIILVLMYKVPALQVLMLMMFSLLNLGYIIIVKPHKESNLLLIFNELTILICLYMMIIYLNCTIIELSINISWVFISVCCFNMIVNLSLIVFSIVKTVIHDIK